MESVTLKKYIYNCLYMSNYYEHFFTVTCSRLIDFRLFFSIMVPRWLFHNWQKKYPALVVFPIVAYVAGNYVDKWIGRNMSDYHNKSALFGGQPLKEGERLWE